MFTSLAGLIVNVNFFFLKAIFTILGLLQNHKTQTLKFQFFNFDQEQLLPNIS